MRLRKAPYTQFRRVSTSLDDFTSINSSPVFILNNTPVMDLELKENDLISFMNRACPQCSSKRVSRNGTCFRTMENGTVFGMQSYICSDCRYSFVAKPPIYGYGKHFPYDIRNKSIKTRVRTSLRKAAYLFLTIGNTIISHETVRRNVPPPERSMMESSGYFVYDEQYVHIDGTEKYRALLKDSKTGNFVESILDGLSENTLLDFFIRSLKRFNVNGDIYNNGRIPLLFCSKGSLPHSGHTDKKAEMPLHIEKDLAHSIKVSHKEEELEPAKRLVKYMFFQNGTNLNKLGKNREAVMKLTEGRNESEKVDLILEKIESMYGEYTEIRKFLDFIRKHRKEVFLYLNNPEVEKTSDSAEQHFSIQS
jgi:transposase-like protein